MKLFKVTSPVVYYDSIESLYDQYVNIEYIINISTYVNEKLPDVQWSVIFLTNGTKAVDTRSIEKLVKDIERF